MKWFDVSNKKHELEDEEQYHREVSSSDGLRKFMEVSIEGESDSPVEEEGLKLFFTISTPHVDRDGDIIDQTGWDLDEYKKNPVVLWAHDSSAPPIARANSTYLSPVANKSTGEDQIHLMSVAEFPSRDLYPFANMVGRLYKNGFLHGASVGFLPVEYEMSKEREGFAPVDFKKQKLLEWSAVPVPSNPEGLVQARSAGIDLAPMVTWAEKILDGEGALILPRHLIEEVRKHSSSKVFVVNKDIKIDMSSISAEQTKTVISYRSAHPDGSPKAPEGEAWDGPKEVAAADVGELYDMSTYYGGDGEIKGDYKLPHHHPDGTVVLRGVQAAMAALMGARGGVEIPSNERKGVYNHLAEHYRAFDKDPPEFRDGALESNMKSIEEAVAEAITEERERIAQMAKEEKTTSPEEKDLTSDENQTKEKAPQGATETNDDDLRRLAKATFERRVLSLTRELKDLIGQISTGDDR
jgi:hypothetical protein